MKVFTINLEVEERCDTDLLLEAITKLVHEGQQNLTQEELDILRDVRDVTEG